MLFFPRRPALSFFFSFSVLTCSFPFVAVGQEQVEDIALPPGASLEKDLVYADRGGRDLHLDLYCPPKKKSKKLPVVVWIHGGGWLKGSKENCRAVCLVKHGFAVASIEYRLTDEAQWPAQIRDCYDAVRFLRTNSDKYGLNPDKIGAWGSSAGGHLAALLGTRPAEEDPGSAKVQAVCSWFGPTDLVTLPPNVVSENRTLEQVSQSNGAKLLGATVRDVPDLAKDASALYHVSNDDPPFLIMHGRDDTSVPLAQSRKLRAALAKHKLRVKLVVVSDAGHGGPEFKTSEVTDIVANFFKRQLR